MAIQFVDRVRGETCEKSPKRVEYLSIYDGRRGSQPVRLFGTVIVSPLVTDGLAVCGDMDVRCCSDAISIPAVSRASEEARQYAIIAINPRG